MRGMLAGGAAATAPALAAGAGAVAAVGAAGGDRAYMLGLLQKMAEPVLANMAKGELKKNFALELSPTWDGRDAGVEIGRASCRERVL